MLRRRNAGSSQRKIKHHNVMPNGKSMPTMLHKFPGRMEVALQTLGVFNLLLLGICAWLSFGDRSSKMANEKISAA
jgi:hypothetical protein